MAPFHVGESLLHAIGFHGGVLTGIGALAGYHGQRGPFAGEIVDQRVSGQTACGRNFRRERRRPTGNRSVD